MAYSDLDTSTRQTAERVLTRKQLDVFKLWMSGVGTARIAIMLDVSQSTARTHLARAMQKLEIEKRKVAA
jgi:DNA-binding CsgD family transcriptional regulator